MNTQQEKAYLYSCSMPTGNPWQAMSVQFSCNHPLERPMLHGPCTFSIVAGTSCTHIDIAPFHNAWMRRN
jgi:hypothetical protein